jgi:hypothetical protein
LQPLRQRLPQRRSGLPRANDVDEGLRIARRALHAGRAVDVHVAATDAATENKGTSTRQGDSNLHPYSADGADAPLAPLHVGLFRTQLRPGAVSVLNGPGRDADVSAPSTGPQGYYPRSSSLDALERARLAAAEAAGVPSHAAGYTARVPARAVAYPNEFARWIRESAEGRATLSYVGRALRAGAAVNANTTHAAGVDSLKPGRRELVVLLGVNPAFGEAVTAHHLRELSLPLIDVEKGLFGDGASLHSVQMGLLPSSLPPAVREGREGAYDAYAVLQLPLRDATLSYLRTYPVPPDGRFEREPPELV